MRVIELVRGSKFSFDLTFQVESEGVLSPFDLTNYKVLFTVKPTNSVNNDDLSDAKALVKKEVTTHVDALNGLTVIQLLPADTRQIAINSDLVYDVKLVNISDPDDAFTAQSGQFKLIAEVTRRV